MHDSFLCFPTDTNIKLFFLDLRSILFDEVFFNCLFSLVSSNFCSLSKMLLWKNCHSKHWIIYFFLHLLRLRRGCKVFSPRGFIPFIPPSVEFLPFSYFIPPLPRKAYERELAKQFCFAFFLLHFCGSFVFLLTLLSVTA